MRGRGFPGTNAIWVEKTVGPTGAPYDIIRVPNRLVAKAGSFRTAQAPIEEIEAMVGSLTERFPELVGPDVERALELWRRIEAGGDAAATRELSRLAHDLKGTGRTYGYPLISFVGASLYALLAGTALERPLGRAAVATHVNALAAVVRGRMAGDGGVAGQALAAGLRAAAAKALAPAAAAD